MKSASSNLPRLICTHPATQTNYLFCTFLLRGMLAVREAMHYASCADASTLLICSFNAAASAYEVKPVFDLLQQAVTF